MNIAIAEAYQGQGIGKQVLVEVIAIAKNRGAKTLEVGTGNSSLDQLAFYQKAGFRVIGVERDFFVRNYPEEIIENGIRCQDMIRLAVDLKPEKGTRHESSWICINHELSVRTNFSQIRRVYT